MFIVGFFATILYFFTVQKGRNIYRGGGGGGGGGWGVQLFIIFFFFFGGGGGGLPAGAVGNMCFFSGMGGGANAYFQRNLKNL